MRVWVAVGGALGAVARVAVAGWLVTDGLPVATLLVNLTGAALLGALAFRFGVAGAAPRDPRVQAALTTGFLGAWTTFSTLAVELDVLLRTAPLTALAYTVATCVGGVLAAVGGRRLAARTTGQPVTS